MINPDGSFVVEYSEGSVKNMFELEALRWTSSLGCSHATGGLLAWELLRADEPVPAPFVKQYGGG
jgi:hypothetical protein